MSTDTRTTPEAVVEKPTGMLLLFIGLMLSMLLAALSQMILSTALPTIVGELHGVDQMLWVITAYILTATIVMPIYGKLGDLMGRKNLLLIAISIFMAGSVVGGLAPDMPWLITGRAIQGLGGGGLMILAQAIIADVVPARERGKYMGVMGGVFAFASVAGPLLGGFFTEGPGWRWMFWINMPLGVLALLVVVFFLHLPSKERQRTKPDVAGMALLAIATTSIVLVGTWGGTQYDWTSVTILGLAAVAIITSVAFVMVERRADEPILPMHLFRERNFNLTTSGGLLIGVTMFGAVGYMPTYLQMVTGASATNAGLLMIPMMGALLLFSTGSGVLVSRTGRYKWMPIAGSLMIAVALFLLSTIKPDTALWIICTYIGLLGAGLGLSMQILVLIVQNTFPNRMVGTATASNNYFRQIGATLGSAIVGSLFTARVADLLTERLPGGAVTTEGGANSLTPELVYTLPDAARNAVIESYNDALTPLFLYMAPLGIIAAILLYFVKEAPLATSIAAEPEVAAGASKAE
ncbi:MULTISPECIES: MDR family MFS transporter [unclassified Arthrobacter]|uniref:MDR family MFS transporter n=1 Tax=unclassified Arthrobacter TaxID=235627 RepID=UPI001492B6A8|nr:MULTISPECIES: MDR family MFS transporter [unclassified Arthrobacter]MBE0010761.1 MFS transporter [Arthrobacter sp. AET 35A]NOJ64557.1 MFS transporter [Arthrobacter sp. 147(2020)]